MSEPIVPLQGGDAQVAPTDAVKGKGGGAGEDAGFDVNTTVNDTSELREKAPKVFKAMMEGIATQIISQMRRRMDRLRKLMREGRRND